MFSQHTQKKKKKKSYYFNKICNLKSYCGAKEFGNPVPFHIKLEAHAEEEEMFEDKQRRSKLPGDVAEDNPVLGKPRSRKEEAACHQGQSPRASQGKA